MGCPENVTDFDSKICTGIDVMHYPYQRLSKVPDEKEVKYNLVAFLRPHSKYQQIGVNFQAQFWLNTSLEDGTRSSDKVNARFYCNPGGFCNQVSLLQFHQKKYHFDLSIANITQADAAQKWIGDLDIIWKYDNIKHEGGATIFRYVGLLVTIVLLIVFWVQAGRQENSMSGEQHWVMYLLIFLILLDNPVYAFTLFYRGGVFSIINDVLDTIGVCFMMLYPLVALGGFITSKMSCCGFYLPRCVLILLYGVFRLIVQIFLSVQSLLDPMSTLNDVPGFRVFNILSSVIYAIWLIWLLYCIIRVFVVAKQHPRAIKGRYRAVILFIVLFNLAFHGLVAAESLRGADQTGAHGVAKMWVANCFGWMMCLFFLPSKQQRMTSTSISGALHPKTKSVRAPEAEEEAGSAQDEAAEHGHVQRLSGSEGDEEYDVDLEPGFTGDISKDRGI